MKKILILLALSLYASPLLAQKKKFIVPIQPLYVNEDSLEGRAIYLEYDRTVPTEIWIAFSSQAPEEKPSDTILFILDDQKVPLKYQQITTTEKVFKVDYTVTKPGTTPSTSATRNSSTIVNPDGTHSTVAKKGRVKTLVNPDGTHSTIITSGRTSTIVNPDGTHSTIIKNSRTGTIVNPNGTHSTIINNGNRSTIVNPNGTHTTVVNQGNTSTVVNPDGSHSIIIRNGSTSTVVNSNGSTVTNENVKALVTTDTGNEMSAEESRRKTYKKQLKYTRILVDGGHALLERITGSQTMALQLKLSNQVIHVDLSRKQLRRLKEKIN